VASAVAVAPRGNFKKLQGGNLRVLVELWARTTEWHQQYRELTENAIQAITEGPGTGTVTWRAAADLLPGARKLSCIDDGHGMSGPEMVRYMNTLAASGRQQGVGQNHGIGAKITTLASNREGVEVRSWVDGVGARVYLTLDGIKEMRPGLPDPERYFEPLAGNQGKPKEIGDHGTMVVLMGNRPDADTTALPEKAKGGGQTRWLPKTSRRRRLDSDGEERGDAPGARPSSLARQDQFSKRCGRCRWRSRALVAAQREEPAGRSQNYFRRRQAHRCQRLRAG
jgi:hypothetical protein